MTVEQRTCEEETGHDIEWHAPEYDVGFSGYGQCRTCGWTMPYEEPDYDDNYC